MQSTYPSSLILLSALASYACAPAAEAPTQCALADSDCDGVPDALGSSVRNSSGKWLEFDFDGDKIGDGPAVDLAPGDGIADGILIDTDGDGLGDAVDVDGDFTADYDATGQWVGGPIGGTGGAPAASGGAPATSGGAPAAAGGAVAAAGGAPTVSGGCSLSDAQQSGVASTTDRYGEANVKRNGQNYKFIANGWGANWRSHKISFNGTAMTVESFEGSRQDNGAPAGYPTMFCGKYSDKQSNECGLPKAYSSISSINTLLAWSHPGATGTYNVAYDVWFGNNGNLSSYFMVWFKNPAGEGPAGSKTVDYASVPGADDVWDIYAGSVNGLPIVNYVRPNGKESNSLVFDMMDFIKDAKGRNLNFPGSDVLSVAVGFEIWEGPVSGLKMEDFCVDVQ